MAAITAFLAFIRLCRPVWNWFQGPKKNLALLTKLDEKFDKYETKIEGRLDRIESEIHELRTYDNLSNEANINLLRDRIAQGYNYYLKNGNMTNESYRSFCDMYEIYHKIGGNSYAAKIMDNIHKLFKTQAQKGE